MNFLAHALLSPDDDEIRAGNVCADLVNRHYPTIESALHVLMPALREHAEQVLANHAG